RGLVAWRYPYQPRHVWQPPTNERAIGFVDDQTLLTGARDPIDSAIGTTNLPVGPIRLRDIVSGEIRREFFSGADGLWIWLPSRPQTICVEHDGTRDILDCVTGKTLLSL